MMRHIIPISGKDSCATALVQLAREPGLPYELLFNDVSCELPETYAWIDLVEEKLGRPIKRIGKSLEKLIFHEGILPSAHVRFCTREAKIRPMEKFIGSSEAVLYFGIRADEDRVGYQSSRSHVSVRYPLKELGIGLSQVYQILDHHGLRPPSFFWRRIYDRCFSMMEREAELSFPGLWPQAQERMDGLPRWAFDTLFAWRSRSNCYFCFFQRLYEWVGLLEHHPDLFAQAERIEDRIGNQKQEKPYTWVENYPLKRIRECQEEIADKRCKQILKSMADKRLAEGLQDLLSVTSCGLLCGK